MFSFYLLTDPHYFENALGAEGEAYEIRSAEDQKCIAETGAIIDAGFAQLISDTEIDTVLIAGDLTFNGEKESHKGFLQRLQRLRDAGKKVYLITARHDYHDDPCGFVGSERVRVEGTKRGALRDLYWNYGFGDAIASWEEDPLSYVAQLAPGIRLLALNCDGDCKDFKGLWDAQMDWALEQVRLAHESGNYIFAMTHYPLLPGSPVMQFISDAKLTDWQTRAQQFADAGVDLFFTGHMHMQSLTQLTTDAGNTITDICTGSFVGCPCAYRKISFAPSGSVEVQSYTIRDFAWDKNGKTAEEYFVWRFERMIRDIIDAMAYNFDYFAGKLGGSQGIYKLKGPIQFVGRRLQKLTVGGLGRLLFVRVDPSLKKVLAKDIGVELVRNVFVGDEPYVPGTPVHNTLEKLLRRLKPVLRIVEKKLGEKTPALQDVPAFVLSMVGDEKQMDYTAELPLAWNRYQ